jgi:hypothetical protein
MSLIKKSDRKYSFSAAVTGKRVPSGPPDRPDATGIPFDRVCETKKQSSALSQETTPSVKTISGNEQVQVSLPVKASQV